MTLKIYNTLSRSKVDFEPIEPGRVRFYVCGPTVYAEAHLDMPCPLWCLILYGAIWPIQAMMSTL